ncbi:MAG: hypothetical protein JW918_01205 [Anaerolineae bacterium]|nr:hypothetical protein [Anaerolineae bacterium]
MKQKRSIPILVSILVLAAAFACGPMPSKPSVVVIAPPNGSRVAVGQAIEVQFRAEDAKAVAWVTMEVDGANVATLQSPVVGGQTPLEGILRWTPPKAGTFNLVLTACNADGQNSDPAAVTVEVVETSAGLPNPTAAPTIPAQPTRPAPTTKPGAPTAAPTAVPTAIPTKPGAPTAVPTNPPTAVPTKPPTAVPTKPPTAIPPTLAPMPEIVAFLSDTDVLYPGDCVTLQWTTRNASELYLNSAGVSNPAGQATFCYADLSLGDNVFRLTAVNSRGSVYWDVTVRVEPPAEMTLSAPFVPDKSGSVSAGGSVINTVVSPGDDGSDTLYEGFMTFDIRALPANATIQSAYLNMGPCSTTGHPATDLGQLSVVNLQYGDLNVTDYQAGGAYITSVDPCTIFSIDVTDRVEAMKVEVFFQVRLYFSGSDFDGDIDDVTYSSPTLDITYTSP